MNASCLAPGPVLECRADGECRRQAVRLLVRKGARRRARVGVAAMAMIGAGRPLVAIVDEGHEGAGDRPVAARERSLAHRAEDTPLARAAHGARATMAGAAIPSQSSRRQQMTGAMAPRYA